MGDGDFRPQQLQDPQPIFVKLEMYNYPPEHDPTCKISGGYVDVGGLCK